MQSLDLGERFWIHEFDVMLVHAELDWQGPARFDEWVDIAVLPSRLGAKSFDLRYTASVDGNAACAATITYVAVQPGSYASMAVPESVRAAFTARMPR
jgi:acyl-CoA thioester hydrolase